MNFDNEKKTFLEKEDKSKKGSIDARVILILKVLNAHQDYYTTSSCSGRVYLWQGSGKKNETEWLKVSHELVDDDFFILENPNGLVWLRVEPFILHVACRDLAAVHRLLILARMQYKKSCLLSLGKKLIVEVRGSEFIEMPLYNKGRFLFAGEISFLTALVNAKLTAVFLGLERFGRLIENSHKS
ncbi:MAG: tRNA wybutosine-synthesizing 3 family protein [Nanoarchaeota archaeon]|nr:tRNA wybutosine-synthesizing 3 family protein [Nanoarchaeota archaeon]